MKRREVITLLGGAAAWPAVARAQQLSMPIIGFLGSESPALSASYLRIFRGALREAGYVEGENVLIQYAWAEGQNDRLPGLVTDLIRNGVSVIAAPVSTPAPLAAKKITATIPIVFFTAGDPVALGLVQSLSRPGGNATGATSLAGELAPKRLELMHELIPAARVMGILTNSTNLALMTPTLNAVQKAASALGIELRIVPTTTAADFQGAFAKLADMRANALLIAVDSLFTARREQLAALSLRSGIPAIYQYRDFAEAGGIMSYGGSLSEAIRLVGLYTGRILRGEKPSDLPVQQTTKAELIVNLKTANTLGIAVPMTLLARADEVIE